MEDFRTESEYQIIDMETLSMHCKQIDADAKAMGLPNLAEDFATEMDRMIWMVQMLYKHPSLQRDSKWRLAEA